MDKKELLELKSEIESAKSEVSKLEGKKAYLMTQLLEQHGCKTIKEAEKKAKQLEVQIKTLSEQIETATAELEEKYELTNQEEE